MIPVRVDDVPRKHSEITLRQVAILSVAIGISTAALVYTAHRLLPNPDGTVGHDYDYYLPYLLAGAGWIQRNGWSSIPYFTPDFCGGMPWLANPQSVIYSLPQILTLSFADPINAVKWSLFFYATAGSVATYVLLRLCFGLSWHAAGLGFVLFQLNGFLLFRFVVGHLNYHTYGLIPVLCLCAVATDALARPASRRAALTNDIVSVIVGACLLAAMVYGGGLNYMIAAVLSASAIIFIYQARTGVRWRPWLVFASACVWAIPLSALKLLPAFMFATGYPRIYLAGFLFDDPLRLARILRALFVPETQPFVTFLNNYTGDFLALHEFEFGVSVVPFFLIVAGLLAAYRSRQIPRYPFAWIGFAAIAVIPILGTFGNAEWGQILVRIPIINNNTTLTRWWSIYIFTVIVLATLSFDRVVPRTWVRDAVFVVCVIIAGAQLTLRDFTFYRMGAVWGLYDPAPVTAAIRQVLVNADSLPVITRLGPPPIDAGPNDGLLTGTSVLPCYDPIFGYSLELFPAHGLQSGPVDRQAAGLINMADPRCYLTAGPDVCRPGDQFRSGDIREAVEFASHRPLNWQQPAWQIVARMVTVSSLCLSLVVLLVAFCLYQLSQSRIVAHSER
jgi:hypothetical protein